VPAAKNTFAKEKAQLLLALLEQSSKKGYIRSDTILKRFARYRLNEEEKEDIFLEFENAGIQVVFPDNLTDNYLDLSDGDKSDEFQTLADNTESFENLDPVHQYLYEIHSFPVLTHKETLSLVRRIQEGDAAAREKLVNCNLRFAFSVATKYICTGLPLLDLVQQANLGLMTAVDKYNPNRGTRFTTYSVFWIKQAIFTYIEEQSRLIKIPSYISSALKKIKSVTEEYYNTYSKYPSDDEIATLTGFSIARVKHLKTLEYSMSSLDSPVSEEMDGTLLDTVQDDTIIDPITNINIQERKTAIDEILNKLSPRERQVLIMHFGLCGQEKHSLEVISKKMNITMERIRQIESLALNKIRGMNGSNRLRNFIKL